MRNFLSKYKAVLAIVLIIVLVILGIIIKNLVDKIQADRQKEAAYESILNQSWSFYKKNYIQNDGRVIDYTSPVQASTSEGESYAMLRAVAQNDKTYFDKVANWSYYNLERSDYLFAWQWGKRADGSYGILSYMGGSNSATDADEQIADALIQAYRKWGDQQYLTKAQKIVHSIYLYDTTTYNNKRYIVGGNWANNSNDISKTEIFTNPSYLEPSAYRDFSQIDTNDNWNSIIDTSYDLLNRCTFNSINKISLPTNWCILNKKEQLALITVNNTSISTTIYSYDAFRTMYNLTLDYKLNGDTRDYNYLKKTSTYLYDQYKKGVLGDTFDTTTGGSAIVQSSSIITGTLANFYITHPTDAISIYKNHIKTLLDKNNGAFGISYYDSNWNWFATYLMSNLSSNNLFNL